jgi:antitoxin component of RelBE/YafQ-DinJ toxin-antitoxin module
MQDKIASSSKNVLVLAHTMDLLNESEGIMETLVKVKGSTMNQGVEAFFSTVISSKKLPLKKLEKYQNDHLTITEEEEAVGFKYVFQTLLTKETVNERIRSPMGLWSRNETFIDNDAQLLLDHLNEYYA